MPSSEDLTPDQIRRLWHTLSRFHGYLSKLRGRVSRFDWSKNDPLIGHVQLADDEVQKLFQYVQDLARRRGVGWSETDWFADMPTEGL